MVARMGWRDQLSDLYQHWSTGRLREHPYISLVARSHRKLANKIPGRKIFSISCFISNAFAMSHDQLISIIGKGQERQWPLTIPRMIKVNILYSLTWQYPEISPSWLVLGRFCRCQSCTLQEHWPRLGLDLSRQKRKSNLKVGWSSQDCSCKLFHE